MPEGGGAASATLLRPNRSGEKSSAIRRAASPEGLSACAIAAPPAAGGKPAVTDSAETLGRPRAVSSGQLPSLSAVGDGVEEQQPMESTTVRRWGVGLSSAPSAPTRAGCHIACL